MPSNSSRKSRAAAPKRQAAAAAAAAGKAPAKAAAAAAKPYEPSAEEKYMSKRQLQYFQKLLEKMRAEILVNNERLVDIIKEDVQTLPDENDRASKESEFTVELRERERERRLLHKVDSALQRAMNKSFGFCQECGDPVGLERLMARPVATLCIECKSLQEALEKSGANITN